GALASVGPDSPRRLTGRTSGDQPKSLESGSGVERRYAGAAVPGVLPATLAAHSSRTVASGPRLRSAAGLDTRGRCGGRAVNGADAAGPGGCGAPPCPCPALHPPPPP